MHKLYVCALIFPVTVYTHVWFVVCAGTTLSKFDRSFLEALSFVLLMVALALLIFIRLRLLRS